MEPEVVFGIGAERKVVDSITCLELECALFTVIVSVKRPTTISITVLTIDIGRREDSSTCVRTI